MRRYERLQGSSAEMTYWVTYLSSRARSIGGMFSQLTMVSGRRLRLVRLVMRRRAFGRLARGVHVSRRPVGAAHAARIRRVDPVPGRPGSPAARSKKTLALCRKRSPREGAPSIGRGLGPPHAPTTSPSAMATIGRGDPEVGRSPCRPRRERSASPAPTAAASRRWSI